MYKKHRLDVFPQPPWVQTISCDGKPCGGSGGCSAGPAVGAGGNCHSEACGDSPSCELSDLLNRFALKQGGRVEFKIADYSSLESILESMEELNSILEGNGEELRVSTDNLELVFSQISPIVAVDGILAFVGKVPTEQELEEALARATPVEGDAVASA